MRVFVFISIISLLLFMQSGCSIGPVVHVTTDNTSLKEPDDIRLMHSDNRSDLMIGSLEDFVSFDFLWKADDQSDQNNIHRIKYHKQYYKNHYVVVEGKIGLHANRYPVVLDTGASQPIFLNISHVLDNKLPVYAMRDTISDLNGYKLGLCYLPLFQIGGITFTNRPCLYLEPSATVNIFGIQIVSNTTNSETVIVGLPILREFNYVMFDNVDNEVEFSYDKIFESNESDSWDKYPITTEEDFHGNVFLFVKISIAGEEIDLQFDSGSGRGLAVGEKLWEQVNAQVKDLNLRKGKDFYPYIGHLACRRGIVPNLQVGERTVKNAEISVFPNDSPLLTECDGLLGMQYFQSTVVVLDFKRSLMWVRNLKV